VEAVRAVTDDELLSFPYKWDETGRCEKLTEDNRCSVYESRPLICKVDKLMILMGANKEQYYKETADACNRMMDSDNIDISLRVKL
jgi:Fe-S-cluster containining protein